MVKVDIKERIKSVEKSLERLRQGIILVEGKRDKIAMEQLGCSHVIAISGRTRRIGEIVSGYHAAGKVFVLTDLDRRGEQLARIAKDECEAHSIRADIDARRKLGYMLNIKYFEDARKGYEELIKGEKKWQRHT